MGHKLGIVCCKSCLFLLEISLLGIVTASLCKDY
uniref:Uncharacterized protein n=1 Tax=Rhizophora mucronata TaxID=61149 RepID=A0A2P2Q3R8_RHIMU